MADITTAFVKQFGSTIELLVQQQGSSRVAVDLPGHGSSVKGYDNEADFYMHSYCKVLLKLIASIDDDILLVGNSLGGHIAIEIAEDIKRLKGLVIFATPPVKKPLNLEDAFLPIVEFQTLFFFNHILLLTFKAVNKG